MNVGSLFSGIGGLDLGLERAGMTVRWQSENDPYCCRVLAKHWPTVPNLGDVTRIDWSGVEPVDLICGGYPCQPFSLAGARQGETDARHLWPRFADAIRHLRPRYALLENVPGHLSLGFGRVLGDLAELGYDTEWDCIPAAAVGAPHLRYRIFVVAYPHREDESDGPDDAGQGLRLVPDADGHTVRQQPIRLRECDGSSVVAVDGFDRDVADTDDTGPRFGRTLAAGWAESERIAGWWAVEPDVGRVAHGIPHRVDRLRALGNAVVPQVAEWLGHRIMAAASGDVAPGTSPADGHATPPRTPHTAVPPIADDDGQPRTSRRAEPRASASVPHFDGIARGVPLCDGFTEPLVNGQRDLVVGTVDRQDLAEVAAALDPITCRDGVGALGRALDGSFVGHTPIQPQTLGVVNHKLGRGA